ncbi:YhcN/YlaJ family sporulation lipoprotein [Bacillus sp. BRMEA1]|uniref:YhcN/YlaJ family sporulation lipoprotein n=1 Tax=Neobacillus endophyticus TaxID=2738405 RepID=UPI001563FE10|nr:YhcN/YlaJ family sporulation lipoprotein [Neobacillus endophyticus]NRD76407.1 YhcN/YlaJ family sporulation lipoprotein [Neobacillus endophyticus]
MKKLVIVIGLCTIMALTGCAQDTGKNDMYRESDNTINVNKKRYELYREGGSQGVRDVTTGYGFVRHQKSPVMNDNTANQSFTALDREQVAHVISKQSVNIPNVHDVSTLVTDQDVLVAYDTDSKDRNLTADQVKKTAMSVVPRFYHVYVTDNKHLRRDVENLASLHSTSRNARNAVNHVINQMKKSPQGSTMNDLEDENGLTSDDHTLNRPYMNKTK